MLFIIIIAQQLCSAIPAEDVANAPNTQTHRAK